MKRATPQDLYDTLSYRDWKTKREMITELEQKRLKVSSYFSAKAYSYLHDWEAECLVRSQERQISEERLRIRGNIPLREYLRISTGVPERLQARLSGLEESLVKA